MGHGCGREWGRVGGGGIEIGRPPAQPPATRPTPKPIAIDLPYESVREGAVGQCAGEAMEGCGGRVRGREGGGGAGGWAGRKDGDATAGGADVIIIRNHSAQTGTVPHTYISSYHHGVAVDGQPGKGFAARNLARATAAGNGGGGSWQHVDCRPVIAIGFLCCSSGLHLRLPLGPGHDKVLHQKHRCWSPPSRIFTSPPASTTVQAASTAPAASTAILTPCFGRYSTTPCFGNQGAGAKQIANQFSIR